MAAPSSCCGDTYFHGTLHTSGIAKASPTQRHVTKRQQLELQAAACDPHGHQQRTRDGGAAAQAASAAQQQPDEDPGTRPRQWVPAHPNRPDLTHTTADIDGAQPLARDVCHRPRNTNPLSPCYQLPAGSGLQWPSGPVLSDKLLRDTLHIADIAGAVPRPTSPAARAAVARTAAGGCCSAATSSRPGLLDISDIDGATAAWRPPHRQLAGQRARDTTLNVTDINNYMARFHPAPRDTASASAYKGHPGGPRAPSPIRVRSCTALMDNSLRSLDMHCGRQASPARRAPHAATSLLTSDIEGAAPAVRDRQRLFQCRSAAAAAASAQQAAAGGVLSSLRLGPAGVAALWRECCRLDRDASGYLTAPELRSALAKAQLQLAPVDVQRLVAGLTDNAGLLSYKRLTRQLRGRSGGGGGAAAAVMARPGSAAEALQHTAAPTAPTAAAAAARKPLSLLAWEQQVERQAPQAAAAAAAAAARRHSGSRGAGCNLGCNGIPVVPADSSSSRPHTAPARATRSSISRQALQASNAGQSSVCHWFAGSARDAASAGATAQWRPRQDLVAGQQCVAAGRCAAPADASQQLQQSAGCDGVAAWLVGADGFTGGFKVQQPFGPGCSPQLAACAGDPASGRQHSDRWQESTRASWARPVSAAAGASRARPHSSSHPAAACRPPSAQRRSSVADGGGGGGVGGRATSTVGVTGAVSVLSHPQRTLSLAERRRLRESERQDVLAVRRLA